MTPGTSSQVDLFASDGTPVGYAIRSCDNQHILTFATDFGFIGLAETMQAAQGLIADHFRQGPQDWYGGSFAGAE